MTDLIPEATPEVTPEVTPEAELLAVLTGEMTTPDKTRSLRRKYRATEGGPNQC